MADSTDVPTDHVSPKTVTIGDSGTVKLSTRRLKPGRYKLTVSNQTQILGGPFRLTAR